MTPTPVLRSFGASWPVAKLLVFGVYMAICAHLRLVI